MRLHKNKIERQLKMIEEIEFYVKEFLNSYQLGEDFETKYFHMLKQCN